jgi:hypothetical protein
MKKQTWQSWARGVSRDPSSPSELGSQSLGVLTGQDIRALSAIVACWDLYACSDENGQRGALAAVRALLPAMQEKTRWIARELIPFVLNWEDRERLWPLVQPKLALVTSLLARRPEPLGTTEKVACTPPEEGVR